MRRVKGFATTSHLLSTRGKKFRGGDKAILLSKVKNINRRVLDGKEDNQRVLDAIEGKSKGPLVDLWIYVRFHVVFLAN